jgi:hypothetical protein
MEIKSTFEYLKVLDSIAELIDRRAFTPEAKQRLKELMIAVKKFEKQALKEESAQERLINDFFNAPHLLN